MKVSALLTINYNLNIRLLPLYDHAHGIRISLICPYLFLKHSFNSIHIMAMSWHKNRPTENSGNFGTLGGGYGLGIITSSSDILMTSLLASHHWESFPPILGSEKTDFSSYQLLMHITESSVRNVILSSVSVFLRDYVIGHLSSPCFEHSKSSFTYYSFSFRPDEELEWFTWNLISWPEQGMHVRMEMGVKHLVWWHSHFHSIFFRKDLSRWMKHVAVKERYGS